MLSLSNIFRLNLVVNHFRIFNLILLLLMVSSFYSQEEKRLALVIGNADYEKGKLKNPVNDAKLISFALDSLGFDVILDTNLERRRDLLNSINKFGSLVNEYDVTFVYYAGHGIQVNNENYLLPTREIFQSELDVEDYGVSLQRILKYVESEKDSSVNILVFDACRDNPFENSWNKSRSIKGNGLAKVNPPIGSIIAFSTSAGNTAPDGTDDNSLFTKSLYNNLLLSGISVEQIFKNVRSEILKKTNSQQRPIENSTLVGEPYILNKSQLYNLEHEVREILKKNSSFGYVIENKSATESLLILKNKILKYDLDNEYCVLIKCIQNLNKILHEYRYDLCDEILRLLNEINSNSDEIKNYIDFLKYQTLRFNLYWRNELKMDSAQVSKKAFEMERLFFKLNSYEKESIFLVNNFSNYSYWYSILFRIDFLSGVYFANNNITKAYELIQLVRKLNQDFYTINKDYFDQNPKDFKEFESYGFVSADVKFANYSEKLGLKSEEISAIWRSIYLKYKNVPNILTQRIYKILSLYEYDLAKELINKLISISPNDPEPYFILYNLYLQENDLQNALINLSYCIERYNKREYYVSNMIYKIGKDLLLNESYNNFEPEEIHKFQLIILKAQLLKKLGNNFMACKAYENAILDKLIDKENKSKIEEILKESCN